VWWRDLAWHSARPIGAGASGEYLILAFMPPDQTRLEA